MTTHTRDLPDLCYAVIPGNAPGDRIGIIKRDERGYYRTDFDSNPAISNDIIAEAVAHMNKQLGVRPSQVEAMRVGSMFGWEVPGADPLKFAYLDGDTAAKRCQWFASCENPATETMAHPILGDVPCCARCAERTRSIEAATAR